MRDSRIAKESVALHAIPVAGGDSLVPFEWISYPVSRASKGPLLDFVVRGLEMRDCRIVYTSEPSRAPFYVVFDSAAGERHGILVYAFFANSKLTKGRPEDERRFQIKYGSKFKDSVLELSVDKHQLVTTLLIGIDAAEGVFIAADPLMNNPSPMSRSVEFKHEHIEAAKRFGWVAWERDRHPGKAKTRPTADIEDQRTEVLIGATQDRLLDLISLERLALDLDPGERHLLADKLGTARAGAGVASHPLVREFGLPPEALFDLIQGTSRLRMAVRGWVAEQHLFESLQALEGVSGCRRLTTDGQPDVALRWRGGPEILIECKNSLRIRYADGAPKVDFQRTRASKGDACSRYYRPGDFGILAACLHAVTENWEFWFALTTDLEPHNKCVGRISSNIRVTEPIFTGSAEAAFQKHYEGLNR